MVGQITQYLSNQWDTDASIGYVNIVFFDSIELQDVFIGDQNKDTLIQAKKLQASISLFSLTQSKLILKSLKAEDGLLKITKSKADRKYNLDFIIEYFSSSTKDTSKTGFEFIPGDVQLSNMSIVYKDYKWNDKIAGIDFEDIRLNNTNLRLSDLKTNGDEIQVDIRQLSFIEKSGFALDQLTAKVSILSDKITFENLAIRTAKTNLEGRFSMEYESAEDFQDFIPKVLMDAEIGNSKLNSSDLAYFAPELRGTDMTIDINGKIKGTVDNLKGRDLKIKYGKKTILEGSAFISGLPNIDETYFDIKVDNLQTVYTDLSNLPKIPSEKPAKIELPSALERLGDIQINGKFNGFLSDFVSYANFKTAAGFFSTDVNFKVNNGVKDASYSGNIAANELDLGLLFNLKGTLDKTSFKANLVGTGLEQQYLNAKLDGRFTRLGAYGYGYQGIEINGEFKQKTFEGLFAVKDPNLDMEFSGMLNLKSKKPSYVFNIDVERCKPSVLGWIERDSSATLSFSADISMEGNDVEDLTGTGLLNKVYYAENGLELELDDLTISADNNPDREGLISIESDIVDAELSGNYSRKKILESAYDLMAYYLPIIKSETRKKPESAIADFDIKLKSVNGLLDIFYPALQISNGTSLTGSLNTITKDLEVSVTSDSIRYEMAVLKGVDIKIDNEQQNINFANRFKEIIINDTLAFINPIITGKTDKQLTILSLASDSRDSSVNDLSMNAEATYEENGSTNIKVVNSSIILNGRSWKVDDGNRIRLKDSAAEIFNLGMVSENESVTLNGILSKSANDKLLLKFENFQTSILNPLLAVYDFGMSGVATGSAEISALLSKPGISADLKLTELAIYQDTLGDAEIKLDFDTEKKEIDLTASVDRGGLKSIGVSGTYYIDDPEDRMNFKISLQKTGLSAFARYAEGIISDVRGKASGDLFLTGNFKKPILTGKLRLQQTSFLFDYLNTRYSLSDEIEFTERYFKFNNITVNDENGNQAKVDGFVYHKNLSDFSLKFDISTNNLQVLNTGPKQNELYYGKGFASGKVKVFGPLDLIQISLALKTEKNTAIFIPLSNPEEVTQSGFINFIQKELEDAVEKKATNEFTGIELDFELAVTSDAEVQLIFDSKIGDIIKGRGNGNLQMNVNRLGDFKMYGDFQTESGDYLFTLQNLINKKFIIKPGGTIRWTGDPYDAIVDIQGVYKLRTSLYDLIRDSTLTQRIPVEVHLKLKEKLFNPALEFDVIIPDIDPTAQTLLNRYISTDQEKSTQTMSLLVLNRFSQANDIESQGTSSSSALGANAAELLSQQLSVWASQISDAFNLGVNYRAADAFSQEEYELELSTRLWNDRIAIDGNLGLSDNNKNTTSGVVGDFNAEVKVSKDGRFRFKVFNKSINNLLTDYNSPYTQGIGILYRKEFDSFQDLFKKSKEFTN